MQFGRLTLPFDLSPPGVRRTSLFIAIVAALIAGTVGYHAVTNEIHGTAIYHKPTGLRGSVSKPVTREVEPAKFRAATNMLWAMWAITIFAGALSAVGVGFYRKLNECAEEMR
jgi:hypothetical protein